MFAPHITEINWKIAPIGWRCEIDFALPYAILKPCQRCASKNLAFQKTFPALRGMLMLPSVPCRFDPLFHSASIRGRQRDLSLSRMKSAEPSELFLEKRYRI